MKTNILILSMTLILGFFITPGYTATITLAPTVDTYVDGAAWSQNFSFSNYSDLRVGKDSSNINRSFVKFNLTAIPEDSIITQANLYLFAYYSTSVRDYNLYHVADDSSVTNSMTWITQPSSNLTYLDVETVDPTGWKIWNLLSVDQAWNYANDLTDDFVSMRITGNESIFGAAWFRSYDSGVNTPYLQIDYQPQVVPIPGALWLLGSGLAGIALMRRKVIALISKQ